MLLEEMVKLDPEVLHYKVIGVSQLIDLLDFSRGSQFVATTTLTEPDYRKTGCPYRDRIWKLNRRIYHINSLYPNMVNNQRRREELAANFTSWPRNWGRRIPGPPFVVDLKGDANLQLYLEGKIHRELEHRFLTTDGAVVPDEEMAPFLRVRGPRPHQGTERPIELRNIKIEHILSMVIQHKGYLINVRA
jgi:hypothetical protein